MILKALQEQDAAGQLTRSPHYKIQSVAKASDIKSAFEVPVHRRSKRYRCNLERTKVSLKNTWNSSAQPLGVMGTHMLMRRRLRMPACSVYPFQMFL